jgi:hypothetical protein
MVANLSPSTAIGFVSAWLAANYEQLSLKQLKFEVTDAHAKTLSAWYETPEYLVDIAVWDHAFCLDILVLDQSSQQLVFSEAGSCGDIVGLSTRLNSFTSWLTAHTAGA